MRPASSSPCRLDSFDSADLLAVTYRRVSDGCRCTDRGLSARSCAAGACANGSSSSSASSCSPSAASRRRRWTSSLVARALRSRSSTSCSARKEGLFRACLEGLALRLRGGLRATRASARTGAAAPARGRTARGAAAGRRARVPPLRRREPRGLGASLRGPLLATPPCSVRRRQAALILELMGEMAPEDVDPRELEVAAHAVNSAYEGVAHWMWDHPDVPSSSWRTGPSSCSCQDYGGSRDPAPQVAIVGTGFSGLGMAIRLKQEGEHDFVLLERADDIGGTWRDNTYPGCRCDVPSHLYSFSFAPNPNWSSTFSPQPEILDYLQDCAEPLRRPAARPLRHRAGVGRLGRRRAALADRDLDRADDRRRPDRRAGPAVASRCVPERARASRASRAPAFHSAQWDHDHDLDGERVAVIGTGASAIQFVPEIQPQVGQAARLPAHRRRGSCPHRNRPLKRLGADALPALPAGPARHASRHLLGARVVRAPVPPPRDRQAAASACRSRHLRVAGEGPRAAREADAELQHRLQAHPARPTSGIRRSRSRTSRWSPTAITEVRPHSVVAADGSEREVDTIIFGTGFHVTDIPIADRVRGRDGRTLAETWDGQHAAPTRAPPSPATRTCSSWSARTPASATPRSCS